MIKLRETGKWVASEWRVLPNGVVCQQIAAYTRLYVYLNSRAAPMNLLQSLKQNHLSRSDPILVGQ